MNFKDAYKSYNDEIKGNPEVLDTILNGKSKAKPVFNFRPVLAYAAMAAVVVSVSVFGYNRFFDDPEPAKRYIALSDVPDVSVEDKLTPGTNNTEDVSLNEVMPESTKKTDDYVTSPKAVTDQISKSPSHVGTDVTTAKTEAKGKTDITPRTATDEPVGFAELKDDEDIKTETTAVEEKSAIPVTPSVPQAHAADEVQSAEEAQAAAEEQNLMIARMVGESEVEMAAYSPDSDSGNPSAGGSTTGSMTPEEYFDYLGIDIISSARLPEDMKFYEPQDAKIEYENGEIFADMFTACAYSTEDSNRNLTISVTKEGPYAGRFTDEISYAYTAENEIVGAYTTAGDVSVSLGVQNVTKEEINNLMKSLKTEE